MKHLLLWIASLTLVLGGCSGPPPAADTVTELAGQALGTSFSVKLATQLDAAAEQRLAEAVGATLRAVDEAMSTYREDSELMAFNRHPAGEAFRFEAPTFAVLAAALEVAEKTGGAYDIAIGPLVNAWGFGPDRVGSAPDAATLEALRERIDARRQLRVDAETQSAWRARDDVFVDLSSIAKGHAVDRIVEVLREAGLRDGLVEVGGEMRAIGVRRDGGAWRIGVEQPVAAQGLVQRIVRLSDQAIATSGDYRNIRDLDGQRVSHIIDPRTGTSIDHGAASVSVVADDCMTADVWATALLVLGPEEGLALAEFEGLAALFLVREGEHDHVEVMSSAFRALLETWSPTEPDDTP